LIHAGLECGVIGAKYPGMQMISFGPDIRGAHTPEERLRVASAESVYDFLTKVLERGDQLPQ
jgi:dipeptidase D